MTNATLNAAELEHLEQLVDKYSLSGIVEALCNIAEEKSAHIEETWQDKSLARSWRQYAVRLDDLARKLDKA